MTGLAPVQANHKAVSAYFEIDPTYGPLCVQKIGYEEGSPTVKERINDQHIRNHPAEFQRFQASRGSIRPVGIPLKRGLAMDDDLIRLFNAHDIMDVETFATLPDSKLYQMMPGNPEYGMELRDRARLMVPEDRRTPLPAGILPGLRPGPASREAAMQEIETLKAALAQAQQEKNEALAMMEAVTAPALDAMDVSSIELSDGDLAPASDSEDEPMRRGPGRPKKVAAL